MPDFVKDTEKLTKTKEKNERLVNLIRSRWLNTPSSEFKRIEIEEDPSTGTPEQRGWEQHDE